MPHVDYTRCNVACRKETLGGEPYWDPVNSRLGVGTPSPIAGTIDDVRVYNRALTASEILQLYNDGGQ